MHRLQCVAQSYAWGKAAAESAVFQLKAKGEGAAGLDAAKPYAEYWFGTHPSGPSKIVADGRVEDLNAWLRVNNAALGAPAYSASSALPYLFKVLSVGKALSVQAHPDRARAALLHASAPGAYPDDNHKPELACALTPFEALCGFRPPADLAAHVLSAPELVDLVGAVACEALRASAASTSDTERAAGGSAPFRSALRSAFAAYMSAPDAAVQGAVAALQARLASGTASAGGAAASASAPSADAVALRLARDFPGDGGVFAPYWLNILLLSPGQAVFLPANEPHAYLSGDCMEVMAASDNVVRAGLTPKFKDVGTLVDMLTYNAGMPPVMEGTVSGGGSATRMYVPPVPEFVLARTELGQAGSEPLPPPPSAAILVVVRGSGTVRLEGGSEVALEEGQVWLQSSGMGGGLVAGEGGLLLFKAHANK
jgi:mannose-6-phosphate isomerase